MSYRVNAMLSNFFSSLDSNDETKLNSLDPISFNNEKRKRLGDGIHESFLHPKPFKIGKISIVDLKQPVKKEKKNSFKKVLKVTEHKFKII